MDPSLKLFGARLFSIFFLSTENLSASGTMAQASIGVYLFSRLKQLGVNIVFGVPGGMFHFPIVASHIPA
jgi:hypothetical protein